MKTLVYLFAVAMLLFAGCAKDEIFSDNAVTPELKKAKVPVPIKAHMVAVPDMESALILMPGADPTDPASYVTSKMKISGNGTHIGLVDADKSFYEINLFIIQVIDDVPYLYQEGTGYIVGANGDSFEYTWWARATLDFNYTGEIELQSGTGKFQGCSGILKMSGKIDQEKLINTFVVDGMMEFKP